MKRIRNNVGARIVASFAVVLAIMAAMTAVALWRLQAADASTASLVQDKLARRQLAADVLAAARLNGLRVAAVARSDSLEASDYFLSQLALGERAQAALEARLDAMAADRQSLLLRERAIDARAAYVAQRATLFKLKDQGRTAEVAQLADSALEASYQDWIKALSARFDEASAQASAVAQASNAQFADSRRLLISLGLLALASGAALAWLLTRAIVKPLRRAEAMIARVAAGDLRPGEIDDAANAMGGHGRDTTGGDEFARLMGALGGMRDRLAETIGGVRANALALDEASAVIAGGNADLARRTEQQAAALEETASSVEQLSAAVRQNSEHARRADLLAQSASQVAGQGGDAVAAVVDTMSAISEAAARIVDITGVIDGIAFQTNLLALNAAVEAARAGEQGRGFAVVAGEVRSLAQRTQVAAGEIKLLIDASLARIASGHRLTATAGATMDDIRSQVAQLTAMIGAISQSGAEQASGIVAISGALADIDAMTQQNASLVGEAAAATAALHGQAARLAATAATFRLVRQRATPSSPPPLAPLAPLAQLELVPVLEPTGKAAGAPQRCPTHSHHSAAG